MARRITFLPHILRLTTDEGFALAILAVVIVASALAFGFGASYELVAGILALGLVTAVVETRLRHRNRM